MKAATHQDKSRAVAWDAERLAMPPAEYFDVDYWSARRLVDGQAIGRGSAWFIETPFGAVVLRRFLRGGWAARVSRDRYLYSNAERSRPFREFTLLAKLYALGLPVPAPVAALCRHRGMLSTGAIMTMRIAGATTLADRVTRNAGSGDEALAGGGWQDVGRCLRKFHATGVWHADLNLRNILFDQQDRVYLVDFDRARFTPGHAVDGANNLSRLKRSLYKIAAPQAPHVLESAWRRLMDGYDA